MIKFIIFCVLICVFLVTMIMPRDGWVQSGIKTVQNINKPKDITVVFMSGEIEVFNNVIVNSAINSVLIIEQVESKTIVNIPFTAIRQWYEIK